MTYRGSEIGWRRDLSRKRKKFGRIKGSYRKKPAAFKKKGKERRKEKKKKKKKTRE